MKRKIRDFRRPTLLLSVVLLIVWCLLGTGSTAAWFSDTDSAVNSFVYGSVKVEVEYQHPDMDEFRPMTSDTSVFDDEALYEPGYTQIVYLKIKNVGDVDFDYRLAVSVNNYTLATNVFGFAFALPDYLRFGAVFAETEAELLAEISNRYASWPYADRGMGEVQRLNTYSPRGWLAAGEEAYAALVVYMPEEVGNDANYRGSVVPRVDLGVAVLASQRYTMAYLS